MIHWAVWFERQWIWGMENADLPEQLFFVIKSQCLSKGEASLPLEWGESWKTSREKSPAQLHRLRDPHRPPGHHPPAQPQFLDMPGSRLWSPFTLIVHYIKLGKLRKEGKSSQSQHPMWEPLTFWSISFWLFPSHLCVFLSLFASL